MADSVNNNGIDNAYKYNNPEISKYDTDNDGKISVFEVEQITDENSKSELAVLLENDMTEQYSEEITEEKIQSLESKLSEAKNKQGVVGSLWNGIKNITGLGSSTNKCEQAIEDYKNGKISYDEAESIISGFDSKQESSVNLAANILTGVAATLVVGSAVLTGGLSLGVIAGAAAVGAGTKAGLKFLDRATSKVEGDAAHAKQIAKDSLSGAVDGAVSVATMGMGTTAVTAKTAVQQTLKETVKQGIISGAKAGAVSGAVTGASDYTIEAVLEEDVEFNAQDLAKSTLMNAAGGAIAGGAMGGISSGIQYKKAFKIANELKDQTNKMHETYSSYIDEAQEQISNEFSELTSVKNENITARVKSKNSVLSKLAKKYDSGELKSTSMEDCIDAIGDAYGTRIQMENLRPNEAKEIIEDCLYGYNITYEQFIKYMNGDTSTLDDAGINTINEIKDTVIDLLKERQSQEVVDQLIDAIGNGRMTITELNNYGDNISSYFTAKQLQEIADAYYIATGNKLELVSLDNFHNASGSKVTIDDSFDYTINLDTKGAVKDSGYASSQMNVKHKFADGTIGNGELQIRGTEVNKFADVEHIPYDIKTGKIKASDETYSDIYKIIEKMSDKTYTKYNEFLTKTYQYLRLKELGIETAPPVFSDKSLSEEALRLLSPEGLLEISARKH